MHAWLVGAISLTVRDAKLTRPEWFSRTARLASRLLRETRFSLDVVAQSWRADLVASCDFYSHPHQQAKQGKQASDLMPSMSQRTSIRHCRPRSWLCWVMSLHTNATSYHFRRSSGSLCTGATASGCCASACPAATLLSEPCACPHAVHGNIDRLNVWGISPRRRRERCTAGIRLDGLRYRQTSSGSLACTCRNLHSTPSLEHRTKSLLQLNITHHGELSGTARLTVEALHPNVTQNRGSWWAQRHRSKFRC